VNLYAVRGDKEFMLNLASLRTCHDKQACPSNKSQSATHDTYPLYSLNQTLTRYATLSTEPLTG
jgi:hypothetical protein